MPRAGHTVHLSCERRSVGVARRFLADVVAGRFDDDRLDTATLLVTEVVTNAVLHAHTDVSVHVAVEGEGLLVQVEDGSPSSPQRRAHDQDAVSGRGLELVEGLADDFGVLATPAGKAVWFSLGGVSAPGPSGWREPLSDAASVEVRLAGLPLQLALRLAKHNEALLRDYELHCHASSADVRYAARITDAARARELIAVAVREAAAAAEPGPQPQTVHVDFDVPTGELASFAALVDVLSDAERLAQDGTLLSGPADAELTQLRDWAISEVLAQVSGGPPVAWPHRRGGRRRP